MSKQGHHKHDKDTQAMLRDMEQARKKAQSLKSELLEHNSVMSMHSDTHANVSIQPKAAGGSSASDNARKSQKTSDESEKPASKAAERLGTSPFTPDKPSSAPAAEMTLGKKEEKDTPVNDEHYLPEKNVSLDACFALRNMMMNHMQANMEQWLSWQQQCIRMWCDNLLGAAKSD